MARLEPGDVSEDQAAADIAAAVAARACALDRAFTGRCNLFAESAGVLVVDKDAIDRLNRIDEAVTLATLPAFKPVVEGEMIATVKIIPFAVAGSARDKAVAEAARAKPVIRVAPYKIKKLGIVSTLLPGLAPKVIDKTLKITRGAHRARRRSHRRRKARAARAGARSPGLSTRCVEAAPS